MTPKSKQREQFEMYRRRRRLRKPVSRGCACGSPKTSPIFDKLTSLRMTEIQNVIHKSSSPMYIRLQKYNSQKYQIKICSKTAKENQKT